MRTPAEDEADYYPGIDTPWGTAARIGDGL